LTIQQFRTAILIGLITPAQSEEKLEEYLEELSFLAATASIKAIKNFIQPLKHPQSKTFVGKGKLQEIAQYVSRREIDLVIFDDELTGSQLNNIEKVLRCEVIDRSDLILKIFAYRAQTAQAKAQVELAKLEYTLPRLKRMWTHLERQRGATATRGGAGEQEIETDRRVIRKKIGVLKNQLKKIETQSATQRKQRSKMIRVALIGYTNVGKSTLLQLLTKAPVFAEDKLFATMDTTVRKAVLNNTAFLLSDTVGFIRKLPHHLIESFKSTLQEVVEADILVHVADISHPNYEEQIKVVNQTLQEIGVNAKPTLTVFNKIDLYEQNYFNNSPPPLEESRVRETPYLKELEDSWMTKTKEYNTTGEHVPLFISATKKQNIEKLKDKLYEMVKKLYLKRYPYQVGLEF